MAAFLAPAPLVDLDDPAIGAFVDTYLRDCDATEAARRAFHFVRDDVAHSWDIQGHRVTRTATDVLQYREGICYAKSHLLAALLRRAGVPTAICYQRLTLFDDESGGLVIHALNAVRIDDRWHRIDARGNKPGVAAEFSLDRERLAFAIRPSMGECDYPTFYAAPHPAIIATLEKHDDAIAMYREGLPSTLPD